MSGNRLYHTWFERIRQLLPDERRPIGWPTWGSMARRGWLAYGRAQLAVY